MPVGRPLRPLTRPERRPLRGRESCQPKTIRPRRRHVRSTSRNGPLRHVRAITSFKGTRLCRGFAEQQIANIPSPFRTVEPSTSTPDVNLCLAVRSRQPQLVNPLPSSMAVVARFLASTQPRLSRDILFVVLWSDTAQSSYCAEARAYDIFDATFWPAMKGLA